MLQVISGLLKAHTIPVLRLVLGNLLKSIAEAEAYLDHPILGLRLRDCSEAALSIQGKSAHDIFGSPDDMKLRSSATLFAYICPPNSMFEQLIDKYFDGSSDRKTLTLIADQNFKEVENK